MPGTNKVKLEMKDRSHIQKQIKSKEQKLRACEDKILALSDVIKHKTKFLKEKNAHEKAVRVAKARLSTHEEYYALDLARRPPDRNDDIRIYTRWICRYGSMTKFGIGSIRKLTQTLIQAISLLLPRLAICLRRIRTM